MTQSDLSQMTVAQLKQLCRDRNLTGYSRLRKAELIEFLQQLQPGNFARCQNSAVPGEDDFSQSQTPDVASPAGAAGESKTPDVACRELRASATSGVDSDIDAASITAPAGAVRGGATYYSDRDRRPVNSSGDRCQTTTAARSPYPNSSGGQSVLDASKSKLACSIFYRHRGWGLQEIPTGPTPYQSAIKIEFNPNSSGIAGQFNQNGLLMRRSSPRNHRIHKRKPLFIGVARSPPPPRDRS